MTNTITSKGPRFLTFLRVGLLVYIGYITLLIRQFHSYYYYDAPTTTNNNNNNQEEWNDFVQDYRQRFHRDPPPSLASWLQFATKHDCETRRFSYDAMEQDLDVFRTQQQNNATVLQWDRVISEGVQYTDHYIAFSLQHNKLTTVACGDWKFTTRWILEPFLRYLLEPLRRHQPPLKMTLFLNLHDIPAMETAHATYPMFAYCKQGYYTDNQPPPSSTKEINQFFQDNNNSKPLSWTTGPESPAHDTFKPSTVLLIPFVDNLQPHRTLFWFWPFYSRGPTFSTRKNAIQWRGSTTGHPWGTGQRFRFVKDYGGGSGGVLRPLQNNHTVTQVDADFGFVKVVQKPSPDTILGPEYRIAKHMSYATMQTYKYIMDVDGNGFTARFPGLLRSGSVVFKSTRYREWFHGMFQPYVDYIPVNYNLTDLVEKVAWVHEHPEVAERILQHSRERVEKYHRVVDMQCYTYRLLLEYQTLFE